MGPIRRAKKHTYQAVPRWVAFLLHVGASGCALQGQSGNEGELPAAPCAGGMGQLFEGTIVSLAGGCVTVRIDRVLRDGGTASGGAAAREEAKLGETPSAELGKVYAWDHTFSEGDSVVVMSDSTGERFEVMPLTSQGVEIHWGSSRLHAASEVLAAPDCEAQLRELPREDDPKIPSSETNQTSPPEAQSECRQAPAP